MTVEAAEVIETYPIFDSGDQAASVFDQLFEEFKPRIYNCTYRLLGQPEDAADATQETFIRAYEALPNIKTPLRIKPWLYQIAGNYCMDQLRRRKLICWEPIDKPGALLHPNTIAPDNPEAEFLQREKRVLVHTVLEKLSPYHRAALVLREYEELSCAEIGEVLGKTRNAVKKLLYRAREEYRQIAQALDEDEQEII